MTRVARLLLCLVLTFLILGLFGQQIRAQVRYRDRTASAQDSLVLFARYYQGNSDETTPLWVLLPMMGHDFLSYAGFLEEVWKQLGTDAQGPPLQRPHVLSADLRGHGRSTIKGSDTLSYSELQAGDFAKYPSDVELLVMDLVSDVNFDVTGDSIYVVGASIGANTAALLTKKIPAVRRLALLSPGLDYRGLRPEDALVDFSGKALILACEEDTYSTESALKLASLHPDRYTVQIFPGGHHGTAMLEHIPEAKAQLVQWLFEPQRDGLPADSLEGDR